ncbi:MAG TPA: hypothetical protein VFT79_04345 [Solirubrobacterales bacterium]|nr:hypothetical protein [Solirubrobacterales bacterium]
MRANAELIAGLAVHLTLLAAPAVAAAVVAVRRGVRSVPVLLGIALLASGLAAFAAFWAYYADTLVGQTWDFFLLGACVLAVVWVWREGQIEWRALRPLATPLALWVLGTSFVVFLGFLHGGTDNAIPMSALRFSGQLPSDNDIPRYFTEWFATHGHQNPPPVYPPDWLMSDRPPLQVGYALSQRAFLPTEKALHYEILCVGVQSFWIVGMWAVLVAARLRLWTRGLAMVAAMVSDVAILHGFFVWPKLIAAAFLLAALAIVLSPSWSRDRQDLRVAALIGGLLALAMLAHGSSIFGVIPLALLAAWRGLPQWRWIGVAAICLIALMLPWTAYQKWANPPGDRLLKWQLGGDLTINDKGTAEAIVDGYEAAGFEGALENKVDNFGEMVGWPRAEDEFEGAVDGLDEGKPGLAAEKVRGLRFFSLLPFLGLLLVAPVAMLIARRRAGRNEEEWRFALLCFAFFGIACLAWGLLLFGTPDSRATIHVGSLAVPLLGLVGCVVGCRSVLPRFATGLVAVNAFLVLLLYTPALTPEAGTSYSPIAALLALACLVGFVLVSFAKDSISSQGTWTPKGSGEVGIPASSSPVA